MRDDQLDLEEALREALERDELHLVYQPIVEVATGRVVSVEALVRWLRPRRGPVEPARFLAAAERAGIAIELGSWVLERAVAQAAAWSRERVVVPVSVNVFGGQLVAGFAGEVRDVLGAHGVPAEQLVLEVTETALMADPRTAAEVLSDLRSLGCRLSMDDFGTGRSSLAHLRELPVQVLKIDRTFVAGIGDRRGTDSRIVAAVLSLADALGLFVVAEGVESPEQAATLERLGCGFGQGFLYSPPRDPVAMRAFLAEHRVVSAPVTN